ncbi:MAG: hypothetical protein AB1414_16580 [bacterium]
MIKIIKWIGVTLLAALIGITLSHIISEILKDQEIASVYLDETKLKVFNRNNQFLWENDFKTEVIKTVLEDIDGDKKKELVIGFGDHGEIPGHIMVLNRKSKELWRVNSYPKSFPIWGGHSDKFKITELLVRDVNHDGEKEVIALANDPLWYASRIIILNVLGKEVGSFWHPGILGRLYLFQDVLSNHGTAVVCIGVNNDFRQFFKDSKPYLYHSVIFLLEATNVFGQAPPYCSNLPKGTHKWYRVILPQGRSIKSVDWSKELRYFRIEINDGRIFYLNANGEIIKKGIGDEWAKYEGEKFDTFYEEQDFLSNIEE